MQERFINKRNIILISIGVLIVICILLFFYPGFLNTSNKNEPLENRRFSMWDRQSIADRMNQSSGIVEETFRENFLQEFEIDGKNASYQAIIDSISIVDRETNQENNEVNLENQFLWGRYLAASNQIKEFKQWNEMMTTLFKFENEWATKVNINGEILELEQNTWAADLEYAEILLTAYNNNPSKQLFNQIKEVMERVWPYFEGETLEPNDDINVERILYPETSSSDQPTENPELVDPYREEKIIRLSDVNLFVLKSFSLIDEKWIPVFDKWDHLIGDSIEAGTQFYPLGIYSDLQNYVATGSQAFAVSTYDNVKILFQSVDYVNTDTLGFYKRALLQNNVLSQYYHASSMQSMSDMIDISSMAMFSEYLVKNSSEIDAEAESLLTAITNGLIPRQYKNEFNDLNLLFYQNSEDANAQYIFYASDQIHVLLSGLFLK